MLESFTLTCVAACGFSSCLHVAAMLLINHRPPSVMFGHKRLHCILFISPSFVFVDSNLDPPPTQTYCLPLMLKITITRLCCSK